MKIPNKLLEFLRNYSNYKMLPDEYNWPSEKITKKDINQLKIFHEATHSAFINFAENSDGKKEDIDLLIELQHEYRTLFTWNNDFEIVFEAGGYLGQKYDSLSDYICERLTSSEPDEIGFKYFLAFCLTVAARTNPHSTELWWNLLKYVDISAEPDYKNFRANKLIALKRSKYPYDFVEISHDVSRGFADSNKYFKNISVNVIKYLISRMIKYGDPPIIFRINEIFGNSPIVNCIDTLTLGEQTFINTDFSDDVLQLISDAELLPSLNFIFLWCKNDLQFRKKAFSKLESLDTTIAYMISFLSSRLARIEYEINNPDIDSMKVLSERNKQPFNLEKELSRLVERKQFFERSLERLDNSEQRMAELSAWEDAFHKFGTDSGAGEMFDFIDTVKAKFVKCSYLGNFTKY